MTKKYKKNTKRRNERDREAGISLGTLQNWIIHNVKNERKNTFEKIKRQRWRQTATRQRVCTLWIKLKSQCVCACISYLPESMSWSWYAYLYVYGRHKMSAAFRMVLAFMPCALVRVQSTPFSVIISCSICTLHCSLHTDYHFEERWNFWFTLWD